MARFNSSLNHVKVAAPCSADWNSMIGNDRARFCGQCNLNVYNLSDMTRAEAESFIASGEGRLCVRFYRRADGSILTDNCPVGLRAVRKRLSYVKKAVTSALLSFLAGLGVFELFANVTPFRPRYTMGEMVREGSRPVEIKGDALVRSEDRVVMGGVPEPQRETSRRKNGHASKR